VARLLATLRNHFPPARGSLLAVWVEYLLTTRFELVSASCRESAIPSSRHVAAAPALGRGVRGERVFDAAAPRDQHRRRPYRQAGALRESRHRLHARARLCHRRRHHGRHGARECEHPPTLPTGRDRAASPVGRGLLVNTPLAPVVASGPTRSSPSGHRATDSAADHSSIWDARRADRRLLPRERLQHRSQAPPRAHAWLAWRGIAIAT